MRFVRVVQIHRSSCLRALVSIWTHTCTNTHIVSYCPAVAVAQNNNSSISFVPCYSVRI